MNFADGYWLMREGVHAADPAQAYAVEIRPEDLTIYAPPHPIRHRGDTLKGPPLTVDLSSLLPDVMRVTLTHLAGSRGCVSCSSSTHPRSRSQLMRKLCSRPLVSFRHVSREATPGAST